MDNNCNVSNGDNIVENVFNMNDNHSECDEEPVPLSFMNTECLERYKFDFIDENKSIILKDRAKVYNKIIETYIDVNYWQRSFIAGGFFTKYSDDREQMIDIFVNINKDNRQKFYYPLQILQDVLNKDKVFCINNNHFFKGVLVTFFSSPNILVHVCFESCLNMINRFAYEPSKIAYEYGNNRIYLSLWYLCGGKRCEDEGDAIYMSKEYYEKNFIYDDEYCGNSHYNITFF